MDAAAMKEFEEFIRQCEANHSSLFYPSLSSSSDYTESLERKLPQSANRSAEYKAMGDPSVKVTEENRDASEKVNALGMDASAMEALAVKFLSERKVEEAVDLMKMAILLQKSRSKEEDKKASIEKQDQLTASKSSEQKDMETPGK